MIDIASTVARRGLETYSSITKGDEKVVYRLPTWAILMLGSTFLCFSVVLFMVCFLALSAKQELILLAD
jgi:hypothetical protein